MRLSKKRGETKTLVVNLLDLGFTVPAIAYMLNVSPVSVYSHLKSAGRMAGRTQIRRKADGIASGTLTALKRVYAEPVCQMHLLMGLSQMTPLSDDPPRASGTRITFRKSAKKRA